MSFILRQIAKRVGAPDIVREKPLAAAEPVIGRGSDCDIQLTDLAVSLRHAVLRQSGAGRVIVESLGAENFEAGGKFVTSASLSLADTPVLGFGSHVLTLSAGEKDTVLVLATVRENAAAAVAADDQKRAFSLKYALYSQRRLAWITGLFILLACLTFPIALFVMNQNQHRTIAAAAQRQWSSGPLSPGHHFLEKNCQACHQKAFVSVKDGACLSCHEAGLNSRAAAQVVARTRELGSPFAPGAAGEHAPHDRLMAATPPDPNLARRINSWVANTFSHPSNRCASCHTEHVGSGKGEGDAAPAPVTPDQVRRNDCKDCHTGMAARLAGTGTPTVLPDVTDWGHHPDFRPIITTGFKAGTPVLVKTALSAAIKENDGLTFGHDVHLNKTGGVARQALELGKAAGYGAPLTCANCHKPAPDGGFVKIDMPKDCGTCHSLTFARRNGVDQQLKHGYPSEVVAQLKLYYANQPNFSAGPELFIGRPGLRGSTPRAGRPVDYVTDSVRNAFERGGTCTTCHTFMKPLQPGSLEYRIAPVRLTARYLLWGDFNHNVPEHRQDENGASTCASCHKAERSKLASDVLLPRIAECGTCHGKSKSEVRAAAGSDCSECHGFHNPGAPATPRARQLAQNALIRTP